MRIFLYNILLAYCVGGGICVAIKQYGPASIIFSIIIVMTADAIIDAIKESK